MQGLCCAYSFTWRKVAAICERGKVNMNTSISEYQHNGQGNFFKATVARVCGYLPCYNSVYHNNTFSHWIHWKYKITLCIMVFTSHFHLISFYDKHKAQGNGEVTVNKAWVSVSVWIREDSIMCRLSLCC